MKQKIRVIGIVQTAEGILALKRSLGRSDMPVFWELPTGKIKFGEQPEEAIARTLLEDVGVHVSSIQIKDVITFLATEGESRLSNLYIVYNVTISKSSKPALSSRYTAFKYIKDFSNANIHLTEASSSVIDMELNNSKFIKKLAVDSAFAVVVNVDGASRGNPGPAGIGYCIHGVDGQIVEQGGEFIGFATSRMAEYCAMRKGVERAIELGYKSVQFVSDSLMVVNQLNGIFKIKNHDIIPVYKDIKSQIDSFQSVAFRHVPRTENAIADTEANNAIDNLLRKTPY